MSQQKEARRAAREAENEADQHDLKETLYAMGNSMRALLIWAGLALSLLMLLFALGVNEQALTESKRPAWELAFVQYHKNFAAQAIMIVMSLIVLIKVIAAWLSSIKQDSSSGAKSTYLGTSVFMVLLFGAITFHGVQFGQVRYPNYWEGIVLVLVIVSVYVFSKLGAIVLGKKLSIYVSRRPRSMAVVADSAPGTGSVSGSRASGALSPSQGGQRTANRQTAGAFSGSNSG